MSFGSGGFGGFGSNPQQPSSGFGGFGASNNPSGFGSSSTGGFGQTSNTGGGMFGNTNAAGGFGSSGGGFGSNAGGGFGSKPAFGSGTTTGGGLFGSPANTNATSSGFGAFGAANTNTSSPFGGANTSGGGLFGNANKTGFGATNTSGASLFGGGNANTGSGFGGGGFGAANNPGLGGGVGDPPGTATTPFQAYTEKEPNSPNQTNAFQNILFQDPYKKWSADELRLADYVQGRRHGNASGAGAFGVSSGFGGGFGSTSQTTNAFGGTPSSTTGGLFGSSNANANATSAFGQAANSAFGGNAGGTSGGLFGNANKPSGGLFGNASNQQSGSVFGAGSAGGFGATNNATSAFGGTSNTGGGLFGASSQANKPQGSGFSFGNANANPASSGFGTTAGGAFGTTTTGSGLFGNAGNSNQSGGGLFGAGQQPQPQQPQQPQQQQQNPGTGFGGVFGTQNQNQQSGGLFGSNQQKPASGGLFGASTNNPSGGLFGNASNQQQTASAFGANTNAQTTGGLFGAAKPTTGTGLFGSANTAQTTNTGTSGLFGSLGSNNQNQQATGSSLFGAASNQQKPGGLFGSTNQVPGSGLFGSQNNPNQGSSLFGNTVNQQQAQGSAFGGSLLGTSQQASNTPQGLTANLSDVSAYGSPSLFAGVGNDLNLAPLATPLNGNSKPRRSSILPMYRLAPVAASRFSTPQKRGFGFSYSSYGTPGGSPASSISSTPGALGRSLLGPGNGGALSTSMSTSNLRRSFNTEDSILALGAFSASANARWYGSTGSKKLVINRDIRSDLFSTPQKDKNSVDGSSSARKLAKRVSFDTSNIEAADGTPVRDGPPAPDDTPKSQADEATPRQSRSSVVTNGTQTPEMEQVKSNELAVVHEEDNTATPEVQHTPGSDKAPGKYWMQPTNEELLGMNRMQRQRIDSFTIGRENVGSITFKLPVDLSGIEIEELCGTIVQLEPRFATVYPVQAKKPPVGKGLNIPARISLEQSWPRGGRDKRILNDPRRFGKHIERLKRIPDTAFEDYNKETGVWTFSVEHFTTYGLDDSDDSDDVAPPMLVSEPPPTRTEPVGVDVPANLPVEDDDFECEQRKGVPGAFSQQEVCEDDVAGMQSFLGVSSADSAPSNVRLSLDEDNDMDDGYDMSEDEDMTRSSVGQHPAAERDDGSSENDQESKRGTPGGILRARVRAMKEAAGPVQLQVADGDDWMEMLRKTVSPAKRDRQLLRELNESPSKRVRLVDVDDDEDNLRKSTIWGKSMTRMDKAGVFAAGTQMAMEKGRGFATSIDLMNSLFERPAPARQSLRASLPAKGFPQWPYERQDKTLAIDEAERAFHDASRPTWGPDETLVVTRSLEAAQSSRSFRDKADIVSFQRSGIQTERQEVRLAKLSTHPSKRFLHAQEQLTEIGLVDDVPKATLRAASLQDMFHHQDMNDPANMHEKRIWELASILFDRLSLADLAEPEHLVRKAKLSQFWTDLVEQASTTNIGLAGTSEEKAVACLAGHRIAEACKHLVDGKNFRLGTLVPLMGTSDAAKKDMREQLRAWHDSKMLSEFSEAIRTIYELLSGNACVCEGMKGVPVEDRMDSFVISKKFGLDWRQSFGLRLWYAIAHDDSAAAAVDMFKEDMDQDKESRPRLWYVEQGLLPLWNDTEADGRQDVLWGLLQLYADEKADVEAALRPENSQLSPLDMRLCWQLGLALVSTGKVSFGQGGAEKADAATLAYAAQLTGAGEWLGAVFVLLHLGDGSARAKAIQEHLCRHAGSIGPESGETFTTLTEKLRIPATWVWEALALYASSVRKDASAEVDCLLRAGLFAEAHRALVRQVAPRAIVERDYAALAALMARFKGHEESISEWVLGGDMYKSFLALMQHRAKGESAPPALVEKLLAGLNAMHSGVGEAETVRYAAVSDMADETAREILRLAKKKQDMELRSRILNLPLTQDRLLAYSVDLGMDRYREVMSH